MRHIKKRKGPNSLSFLKKNIANHNNYAWYKGFVIKKCIGSFNSIYYTIINEKTHTHVHAETLGTAKVICDTANKFINNKNPYKTSRDICYRALELAFRVDLNKFGKYSNCRRRNKVMHQYE